MYINALNHFIAKLSGKVPLRIIIIVPFVIQIFAVVGLTGWLSLRNGQKAVDDLATQLRNEITTRIYQHLKTHTTMPYRANQLNVDAIHLGKLDLENIDNLERRLRRQVQQFDTVSYIGIGTETGKYVGVQKLEDTSARVEILDNSTTGYLNIWNTSDRTEPIRKLPNYNHKNKPWYASAVKMKHSVWSKDYFSSRRTTLSINQPIYNHQEKLLGVAIADINILKISQFLRSLKIGQTGQTFIIERSGRIVATSTPEKPYRVATVSALNPSEVSIQEQLSKVEPFKAVESRNALTRATAHYLIQHFGDLNKIDKIQNIDFTDNLGLQHFVQVKPFKDEWGLNWLIVIVVPEADFMGHIDANVYFTILLCLVALFVTILVGILSAQWIIQPLLRLNTAATALAKGEWQQMVEVERQDEVGELAKSFSSMAKQLQEFFTTLEAKNAELQHLDQLKDEFLANTSHELRTPLNGIIGIAESLIDGASGQLSAEINSELSMIVASGRRLSSLVNDILDFSKQKHKKIELQLKPVNLQEITEIVLRFCKPLVGNKDLQLINTISADMPLAYADENRLQQILHNLVGNAIKFTERGHIKISAKVKKGKKENITAKEESEANNESLLMSHYQLIITVADTGIGIPVEKTTQIFESFEKMNDDSDNQHNGTGLGLAVTKQLVALHGGEIWVESTVGIGSRFIFTLPITTEQLSVVDVLEDSSISALPSLNQTDSIKEKIEALTSTPWSQSLMLSETEAKEAEEFKIMIVDDEPVNLHVLTNHLSLNNYTTIKASSGFEAIAALKKGVTPDLILLDVMMPRMSGYEVTQKIRENWEANELPIVLLTAKNQVTDRVMGLEVGANDYLVKPISKNELLARIKTHLHIKQLKAETLHVAIESERRLNQFLEAMPVGVFVTDAHGHPYYANQRAQQLLGKGVMLETTAEEFSSVYQIYLADTDRLYPNDNCPNMLALQGKSATVDDIEIHHPEKQIPIEAWGSPIFDEKGNITYAMMAFQDITERKQAEAEMERFHQQLIQLNQELENYSHTLEEKVKERTRKLAESEAILADAQRMALLGSWVWDIKTGTVLRSAQDYRNFQQKPKNDTSTYQAFIECIHPDDKNIMDSMVEKCILEGKTAEFEFRVIWPDNQIRTMRSQTELEVDASDTPFRMKGFTQDITERKEVEVKLQEAKKAAEDALQQLKDTQQQLVEAAKMADLGNLVAGVAHEINTPIGIGVTAASRLETLTQEITQLYKQNKMKRADLDKYLSSAQQGSQLTLKNLTRAAELIQSFKQVAVDQAGEKERTFDLKKYLQEILTTLQPEFKRTKHQVTIVCDEDIILSSYPGVFSQIITNFIMNSLIHGLKEQPEGQMTITVQKDETEAKNNLILRYSDNGKGIPTDVINKIFDPFFTTNRQGGGSGLGLHIVFNLVTHRLNGTIQCDSVVGTGTTFIIQIPIST